LNTRLLILIILLADISGAIVAPANAKPVVLKWSPLKSATQYELVISKGKKTVLTDKGDASITGWNGDLPYGYYTYRLRGLNHSQKPGKWTDPVNLVVAPPYPEPLSPAYGAEVSLSGPKGTLDFRWKALDGVTKFDVEVKRRGSVIIHKRVEGTSIQLKRFEPGPYSWTVCSIIQDPTGTKSWRSPKSPETEFRASIHTLPNPEARYPMGLTPQAGRKLRLSWTEVPEAEGYQVFITRVDPSGARKVASDDGKKYFSRTTSVEVDMPVEGNYRWTVRAVAGVSDPENPNVIGKSTATDFILDIDAFYHVGEVGLYLMSAANNYSVASPSGNTAASNGITSIGIAGDFWLTPEWGVSVDFRESVSSWDSQQFFQSRVGVWGSYRYDLPGAFSNFTLVAKAGAQLRQYLELLPGDPDSSSAINPNSPEVTALGPSVILELTDSINETINVGLKGSYFLPLSVLGGRSLTSIVSYQNWMLGLESTITLDSAWGASALIGWENNALSFNQAGAHQIELSGILVQAGLTFGW
jgi:hypothetical protein